MVSKPVWNTSPAFSCREDSREGRTSVGGSFCQEHLLGVDTWSQRLLPSGNFIFANPWLPDKRAFNRKKLGWQQVACTDKKVKESAIVSASAALRRVMWEFWWKKGKWVWRRFCPIDLAFSAGGGWACWTAAGQQFLELETNYKAKQHLLSLVLCFWRQCSALHSSVGKETCINTDIISKMPSFNWTSLQPRRLIPVWLMKQLLSSWSKSFIFVTLFALCLRWTYRLSAESFKWKVNRRSASCFPAWLRYSACFENVCTSRLYLRMVATESYCHGYS